MTTAERAAVRELITRHEGYRQHPYRCSAGKITIGVGRNLDDVGIDREEARYLLDRDIDRAERDLATFPWWVAVDRVRQRALIDKRFQLGPQGFRGFTKMLAACARGDWGTAAAELLDSRYHQQVGARAERLAQQLVIGEWI
mgnify:CR=1 FL=1